MRKLSWLAGLAVFLVFFGVHSYRLGIEPEFWHDDYEYTYPSFSLAERGNFGSPLLGTAFNIQNRTYHFTVYYYATIHAALILTFGDRPESIPLANTFHFALLAAIGVSLLLRRGAVLGIFVFLYALTSDERMITAARQGRPEMTAGFCLTMGVLALWLWFADDTPRPAVLVGMSAAFVAGMLTHTAVLFFAAALLLAFSVPLARRLRPQDLVAAILPYATIPLLYGYFILTDGVTNIRLQLGPQEGNVMLGRLFALGLQGEWSRLASVTAEFIHAHVWHLGTWLGVAACLAAPAITPSRPAQGARFFAAVYVLFLVVHFLFLKVFVLSYRVIYQATFYVALAFLAEAILARLGEVSKKPEWVAALRVAGVAVLLSLSVAGTIRFRERLWGRHLPYSALQGAWWTLCSSQVRGWATVRSSPLRLPFISSESSMSSRTPRTGVTSRVSGALPSARAWARFGEPRPPHGWIGDISAGRWGWPTSSPSGSCPGTTTTVSCSRSAGSFGGFRTFPG